jgi:hypothetical protein
MLKFFHSRVTLNLLKYCHHRDLMCEDDFAFHLCMIASIFLWAVGRLLMFLIVISLKT